jgi:hypothetical protein
VTALFDTVIAHLENVVLLKLYAGGSQDRWDIEQLLAGDTDGVIRMEIDRLVADLPARCAQMWAVLRDAS